MAQKNAERQRAVVQRYSYIAIPRPSEKNHLIAIGSRKMSARTPIF